jgi:1-aminocyclopropane-1-carboxylate deaminase
MTIQTFSWPDMPDLPIHVYRLDQNQEVISGNKFYKLQPWLHQAKSKKVALLSCGGAYSNHLHALAFAGQQQGLSTYGLVRGLEKHNLTVTLQDCKKFGMTLFPVTRDEYRQRYSEDFVKRHLESLNEDALWVPEGGTNDQAVAACEQIGQELNHLMEIRKFTSVWIAVGSGGTLAGVARSLHFDLSLYAVPVMRRWHDVRQRVESFLTVEQSERIRWVENAEYGGFGRYNRESLQFHRQLEQLSEIEFDPVYTAKAMRRMLEMYVNDEVSDAAPLLVHTGGLQGRRSIMVSQSEAWSNAF